MEIPTLDPRDKYEADDAAIAVNDVQFRWSEGGVRGGIVCILKEPRETSGQARGV
jgi:hypothetical protein